MKCYCALSAQVARLEVSKNMAAKCVKVKDTMHVLRVPEQKAKNLVAHGTHHYVKKGSWRRFIRNGDST